MLFDTEEESCHSRKRALVVLCGHANVQPYGEFSDGHVSEQELPPGFSLHIRDTS